jgi:hypothetical protein
MPERGAPPEPPSLESRESLRAIELARDFIRVVTPYVIQIGRTCRDLEQHMPPDLVPRLKGLEQDMWEVIEQLESVLTSHGVVSEEVWARELSRDRAPQRPES